MNTARSISAILAPVISSVLQFSLAHAQVTPWALGESKEKVLHGMKRNGLPIDSLIAESYSEYQTDVKAPPDSLDLGSLSLDSMRVRFDSLDRLSYVKITMHVDSQYYQEVYSTSKRLALQSMHSKSGDTFYADFRSHRFEERLTYSQATKELAIEYFRRGEGPQDWPD